jgi:hypothetical protein
MASKLRWGGLAIVILLLRSACVPSAMAQSQGDSPKAAEQLFRRGFTDADLVAEKKLLADKSKQFGWVDFPMLQFPRTLIFDKGAADRFGEQKAHELSVKHLVDTQKRFIDSRLKGRTFAGQVRVGRIDNSEGGKTTVSGREPSRPGNPKMGMAFLLSPYDCQWDCDSADGFKVGVVVEIKGSILDLKDGLDIHRQYGDFHCLYLENVSRTDLNSKP